jgi:hypothetical protein
MLTPRTLAGLYDLHLAAVWRGHAPSNMFNDWLEAHWCPDAPSEPPSPPDAVRVLGGAGAGIRSYAAGEAIVGFVAGRSYGSYVVARDEQPPRSPSPALPGLVHLAQLPETVL